ncbi:MFS transporter [Kroppenstedtia pulmonis]|uniref:MFS transporter n=1 Tax=Kroppenstedtia pulmonis TaxID=1380685 RepID=A0A7D3Y179_9BACL|nr:MFS transporter [Kroppenstedtia pulmonis]QKG85040.1 MFS transporter [Kroppenstedtia pulmonis]
MKTLSTTQRFADKVGIPSTLFWGYVGVLIFMLGDGLEMGWLSPYLIKGGLSVQQSASIFTAYGIALTVAAWFSGVMVEIWGPRKTMTLGLALFVVGSIGFITIGLPNHSLAVMLPTYSLRGFGYPLFAYAFLVWVTYRSPQDKLGTAVGWFWFAFTAGLNVLGSYYSSWVIPLIGEVSTLWTSLIFVTIGGIFALVINRDDFSGLKRTGDEKKEALKGLIQGITIVFENYKIGLGGIVRTINTTASFGFVVFLPSYMIDEIGFTQTQWLQIYGTMFLSNIFFNLIFGVVGDKVGWRNTVMWFGGVGCGIFTLLLYYVPLAVGPNYWIMMLVSILFGAFLAAYVPLSALLPSITPDKKGASMSILNLGAGLSAFVGPALVGVFIDSLGNAGVMWLFSILYFISAFLCYFITLPQGARTSAEVNK